MLEFQKVRVQNFLSYGNDVSEIVLNEANTTLIRGKNGCGKSSIVCDGISFGLFNKAYSNKTKPQLVNAINGKACLVEIDFRIGKASYMVRRGISPDIFEIYKNGSLIPQEAAVKDYQKILEETILQMDHKTFKQVVVLGSSSYKHFMDMTAKERRDVVEYLLGIDSFSKMNVYAKKDHAILTEDHDKITGVIANLMVLSDTHSQNIVRLNNMSDDLIKENEDAIAKIETESEDISTKYAEIEETLSEISEEHKTLSDRHTEALTKITSDLSSATAKRDRAQEHVHFLGNNSECVTCRQIIDENFRDSQISEQTSEIETADARMTDLEKELEVLQPQQDRIAELESQQVQLQDALKMMSMELKQNLSRIQSLQKTNNTLGKKSTDIQDAEKELETVNANLKQAQERQEELEGQLEESSLILSLLKDSGIKSQIINQYVPIINQMANHYLDIMDFFVLFELDKNFNESMKSRYRDLFTYGSFSEGEKQKINLALLFTWREIARMKNSISTNLLVLDETADPNVDADGIEIIIKMLESLGNKTNTVLISHRIGDVHSEKFENRLKVSKVGLFSQIEKDE